MQLKVYGAEAVGPINATGDFTYKVYGEYRDSERVVQGTLRTNKDAYNGAIRALINGDPCLFTVLPQDVLVMRVSQLEKVATKPPKPHIVKES